MRMIVGPSKITEKQQKNYVECATSNIDRTEQ